MALLLLYRLCGALCCRVLGAALVVDFVAVHSSGALSIPSVLLDLFVFPFLSAFLACERCLRFQHDLDGLCEAGVGGRLVLACAYVPPCFPLLPAYRQREEIWNSASSSN